jgi:predicted  nucleic acid-binding Zn-ribbon protein
VGIYGGAVAVIALVGLIATKYLTSTKLQKMRKQLVETEREIRKIRGTLKMAVNSKAAAEIECREEEKRMAKTESQISKMDQELNRLKP